MELARHDQILAIRTPDGDVVGFHARNLQVAVLDDFVWRALKDIDNETDTREAHDELISWNLEIDSKAQDAQLPPAVRALTINVAQICNLHCSYCAAGGDGTYGSKTKHIDLETIYQQLTMLLHDVPNGEKFTLNFLGGEPLIAPDTLVSIVRFAKLQTAGRSISLRVHVVTNGTLITPAVAEKLASIHCHVTISLDGPPEINNRYRPTRGGRGSTFLTLRGIENLKKVRDRLGSLTVGSVFGKHNTDVVATYEFLSTLGFDSMKFDFAAEDGDGQASQDFARSLCETAELAFQRGGEEELRRISIFDHTFHTLDSQKRIHNFCGAGKSHLQVDTEGRFYACQWFIGDESEELGRGTEIDSERIGKLADPLTELHDCSTCWARHLCGGGCMYINKVKSGSKHVKDSEFCFRTRYIFAKGIETYAKARYQVQGGDGEAH